MSELKTVDEVEVGYNKSQIYWRISKLVESGIMEPPQRGDRNQYLLDSGEVKLLRRLAELEASQDTVKEAIEQLEGEGLDDVTEGELRERVAKLEDRIGALEDRLNTLETTLADHGERIQKFVERRGNQLRGGMEKIRDLFR